MQDVKESPTLPWDDVRVFLALSRSRTLGEAGRRLGVDGSTMSRRLVSLEEALSADLFERSRSGIRATEAAERLLPIAEEMEHVMARFRGEAETFERDVAGRVRLTAPGDAAEVLLAPLLPRLLERHPRLRIDLLGGETLVDMARREADIALRTVRPTTGDLLVARVLPVAWRVAAGPELVAQLGTLKRLGDAPWIGCTERLAGTTPGRFATTHVADVDPVVRSDSLTLQVSAARLGLGVALVPEPSIAHYGLVPVKLSRALKRALDPLPEDDLFLVAPRALRSVPRVRAVWEFLREHVG
ncbi:MAG: LysR family transcriptional regulator [Sandaracinaceae bacterium]